MSHESTVNPTTFMSTSRARAALRKKYDNRIVVNPVLNRSLVSYQANRKRPYYRWFKYKEGFSAALVEYMIAHLDGESSRLLDPFAGSGAALFAGCEQGCATAGIELLRIGCCVIRARLAANCVSSKQFREEIKRFSRSWLQIEGDPQAAFPHLRITRGAFSAATEGLLTRYRTYVRDCIADPNLKTLFELAGLSVLESVSYTRKDGQYLRWDHRAPRQLKHRSFDKGPISGLEDAIIRQLNCMADDFGNVDLFANGHGTQQTRVEILEGSCFDHLPHFGEHAFDLVITSPPYCNRYDYTRTYALELAYLGVGEAELKSLRQALLSCTVENRTKRDQLASRYEQGNVQLFRNATDAFKGLPALQEVLGILAHKGATGALNNSNVPRMVQNYFLESAVVIFELARIIRPGGYVVMVNDNVQYGGEEVPVDLILSELASKAGFSPMAIWTLGRGKGNSSQQMGAHGRNELRKCAYLWRRDC